MKLLVVEDEGLTANNLASTLARKGYDISGIAASGEDALEKMKTLKPDLVLMDIHLKGEMDGIATAERVRSEFAIPVIFLTAYADPSLLDRAKRTHPFGYLVKPVRQSDLAPAIEVALYKHQMEKKLGQREAWLTTTLRCAGDGVIITDADGRIEFLNDLSMRILCIHDRDVIGEAFCDVVRLQSRFTGAPPDDLVKLAISRGGTMSIGSDLILVDQEADIEGEVALCEINGSIVGTVFTFRDVTVRNYEEEQRLQDLGTNAFTRLASAVSAELRKVLQDYTERSPAGDSEPAHSGASAETTWRQKILISELAGQLDFVSCRSGLSPVMLDLNALLLTACAELSPGFPSNTELVCQLLPELYQVYANPNQIKQAIISLILHSQRSMQKGGTIHISTGNCAVERRGRTGHTENYVRLTLTNTGSTTKADGISGTDRSTDESDLRLFIAQEIMSSAGAYIHARPKLEQGMSFEVLLPRGVGKRARRCNDQLNRLRGAIRNRILAPARDSNGDDSSGPGSAARTLGDELREADAAMSLARSLNALDRTVVVDLQSRRATVPTSTSNR